MRPTISEAQGGRAVSAAVLGQCLVTVGDAIPYVREYQAVQESLEMVELRVVPTARYTARTGETLRRQLESLLGPEMHVRVAVVDALERTPSGKRLAITSRIGRNPTGQGPRAGPAS